MTDTFLSPEGERAWTYLRRHLDRSRAFWLGFVLTADVRAAGVLRDRAGWNRRARTEPVLALVATSPTDLTAAVDRLTDAPAPSGLTWIEGVRIGDPDWEAAWGRLLQALNHQRDSLRSRLGGLVLVGPRSVQQQAQRLASDLWSVRDLVVDVPAGAPAGGLEPVLPDGPAATVDIRGLSLGDTDPGDALALLALPRSMLATTERSRVATEIAAARRSGDEQRAAVLMLALAEGYLTERDRAGAGDMLRQVLESAGADHETRPSALWSAVDLATEMGDIDTAAALAAEWVQTNASPTNSAPHSLLTALRMSCRSSPISTTIPRCGAERPRSRLGPPRCVRAEPTGP